MSESLQDRWEATDDLQEHMGLAQEALAIMEHSVVLPNDKRWQLAYSTLATSRGQESGVMAIGPFGTAKTTLGNLMLGPDQRISVNSTDTEATLFGHTNPMPVGDSPHYIEGKFKEVDAENPAFYLNELTHMRNQKPVQQLWDGEELRMDGRVINLQDAAYFITSNFANGRDVFPLSPSILSRIAAEVLTGDVDDQTARAIQSAPSVDFTRAPILPPAAARKTLAELVANAYPNPENSNGNVTGNFAVDLISRLNESGLVSPVSAADARTGKALASASRALMFERKDDAGTPIKPMIVARIAALVMPTVVKLSGEADNNLMDSLGRPADDLEKAIAVRRIVAREALRVAFDRMVNDDETDEEGREASIQSAQEIEDKVSRRVDKFSYADHTILGYDIDRAVAAAKTEAPATAENHRGVLRGLRNRRQR